VVQPEPQRPGKQEEPIKARPESKKSTSAGNRGFFEAEVARGYLVILYTKGRRRSARLHKDLERNIKKKKKTNKDSR